MSNTAVRPATKKYKIVLLGESGVGKSSLAQRLVKDDWNENLSSTIGASFFRYACVVNDTTLHFDIWDTAGQERYKSLASMYYRGAAAAVVVYDVSSLDTFEHAKYWVRELAANSPDTTITLVGNKKDLEGERKVTAAEGLRYATELGLLFSEVSAKDGSGVREAFDMIGTRLMATTNPPVVRGGGVVGANGGDREEQTQRTCC